MCGIIGYLGKDSAITILQRGLHCMEYRGYDSCGISYIDGNKIETVKAVGKVENLDKKLIFKNAKPMIGIAHTRWATHGKANIKNAHPHDDCRGKIKIVHNGIIENYYELKKTLIKKGHIFKTDTDSEVIAHMIEENYSGNLLKTVLSITENLKGAYGLVVMHRNHKDELIAVKLGSPLMIGKGEKELIVASDSSAMPKCIKNIVYMDDGEIAVLKSKRIKILDFKNNTLSKKTEKLDREVGENKKDGFEDFMLKEIYEQPESIRRSLAGRINKSNIIFGGINNVRDKLIDIEKIIIVACGTAKLAGQVGKYLIEEYLGIDVEVEYASEFRYRKKNYFKNTAVLAISQSGETADTKAAIELAKEKDLTTLGIINVVGSTIARMVDAGIYTHSGQEVAVASTKAFTSQIVAIIMLTAYLAGLKKRKIKMKGVLDELQNIPNKIEQILKQSDAIKNIAKKYAKSKNFAFVGRKYNFPIAMEGAIKLKEISYIHAEGFASGELKHGPIALIDKNFPSFAIVPKDSVYKKNISNIEEIKARNGKVIAVATQGDKKITTIADDVIFLPETKEAVYPILSVIPAQLLSYYIAKILKKDVDKPRNLAKSVTVE